MTDAKEAVRIATEYMNGLYEPDQIPNLTLEEVELDEEEKHWLVTLSFSKPHESAIEAMTGQKGIPIYKVLKIHAGEGRVLSMKIRQV